MNPLSPPPGTRWGQHKSAKHKSMKRPKNEPKYPRHHKVGNVVVTVFDESTPTRPKYRVRWYTGRKRDAKAFDDALLADAFAIGKATELNDENRPPSKQEMGELRRKAILFEEIERILAPHNWTPARAADTFSILLTEMGDEGVRHFSHLYAPRLAKVRPHQVEDALKQYRQFVVGHDQVSTAHRDNLKRCFEIFEKRFGKIRLDRLECGQLDSWLEEQQLKASTRDKWLYGLRGLFAFARDYLKALPQTLPTEIELVRRTKSDKEPAQVFTIAEILAIGSSLPDQETMLAFALVLFGHLRQEEAQQLLAEDFRRTPLGIPHKIIVNNEVVKRVKGQVKPRDITIKPK